jgi:DNA-binding NarL/FixJ family response regulator
LDKSARLGTFTVESESEAMATNGSAIDSKRVLIIEDEFVVGLDIQSTLIDAGFEAVGPIPTVSEAVLFANQGVFDVAVVDANLNGCHAGDVASALIERNIPFVVVSGYSRAFLPLAASNAPLISKPVDSACLVAIVQRLCRG